jgi:hypothetical protein
VQEVVATAFLGIDEERLRDSGVPDGLDGLLWTSLFRYFRKVVNNSQAKNRRVRKAANWPESQKKVPILGRNRHL